MGVPVSRPRYYMLARRKRGGGGAGSARGGGRGRRRRPPRRSLFEGDSGTEQIEAAPLSQYLLKAPQFGDDELALKPKVLSRWWHALDVVTPDSTRCGCFTAGHVGLDKRKYHENNLEPSCLGFRV